VSECGVKVFAPKGPLFFGAVKRINQVLMELESGEKIKIDLSGVVFIDLSGAFALDDAIESLKTKGVEIQIISTNKSVNRVLDRLNLSKKWKEKIEPKVFAA